MISLKKIEFNNCTLNIKLLRTVFLLLITIFISFFESNSIWVENYYYPTFYPLIATTQRMLFGWIPFSIGDIIYLCITIYLLYKLYSFILNCVQKRYNLLALKYYAHQFINYLLIIFICFKLLWGLNYSRQGINHQLQITKEKYNKEDIILFINKLIVDANFYRKQIKDTSLPKINFKDVVKETKAAYSVAVKQFSFLKINTFSLKQNLYSTAGNYLGYAGYYNPFTGEAQVRTDIPSILIPSIACHEVAHQLGYASEDEANFIAYLITNTSTNIYFKYSITLELMDYAFKDLMIKYLQDDDYKNYRFTKFQLADCCSNQVKKDRKEIKYFFLKNNKDISNISSSVYDQYLKLNKEKNGIDTYANVVELILNYENGRRNKSESQ